MKDAKEKSLYLAEFIRDWLKAVEDGTTEETLERWKLAFGDKFIKWLIEERSIIIPAIQECARGNPDNAQKVAEEALRQIGGGIEDHYGPNAQWVKR